MAVAKKLDRAVAGLYFLPAPVPRNPPLPPLPVPDLYNSNVHVAAVAEVACGVEEGTLAVAKAWAVPPLSPPASPKNSAIFSISKLYLK